MNSGISRLQAWRGFKDAVSIEIMKDLNIEKNFGFDSHFDGIVQQVS